MPEAFVRIQGIPFLNGREMSSDADTPTFIDMGNGRYAAIFQVRLTSEGMLISTKKPEINIIANVGFGNVVWGCRPILKVDGGKDKEITPDSRGDFLLRKGKTYELQLPEGYGERVTHFYKEP